MPKITIVTLLPGEIEKVIDVCKFSPINSELEIEIIYPQKDVSSHQAGNLKLTKFEDVKELPVPDKSHICFFASPISCDLYRKQAKINVSSLYVHPELAILQLQSDNPFKTKLSDYGLSPCVLEGDAAADLYIEQDRLIYFCDFQQFMQNKNPNFVLLSTNTQFVESLISMDSAHWEHFHPELNYRNLCVGYNNPHRLLLHSQKQLLRLIRIPDSIYDLGGIRYSQQDDSTAYSFFATHYDQYMAHVDYESWVNYVLSWFKQYSSLQLNKILELACGTANFSEQLVNRGYQVYACDNSIDMSHMAAKKAVKPILYYASLTDPIPGRNYQLIICMFDSINYLTQAKQITKTLNEVSLALENGGLFVFDISTLENSLDNFSDVSELYHYSDGLMLHQAWFESVRLMQKSALHFFKKDTIGYCYQYEQHLQRVYFTNELIELIHNSPLKLRAIHSTDTKTNFYPKHLNSIDEKYSRLFFILEKI